MNLSELYVVRQDPGGPVLLITHDKQRAIGVIREREDRWAERFLWSSFANAYVAVESIALPRVMPRAVSAADQSPAAG